MHECISIRMKVDNVSSLAMDRGSGTSGYLFDTKKCKTDTYFVKKDY
jgi:hypothetical protein